MTQAGFTFAEVFREWRKLTVENLLLITKTISVIVFLYTFMDYILNRTSSGGLLSFFVFTYGQHYFVRKLLSDEFEKKYAGEWRYGALFIAGFLSGFAILFGMMFFLIPGLILASRWSISTPFVIAEGMDGAAALKASWRSTKNARRAVFCSLLVFWGALIILLFGLITVAKIAGIEMDKRFLPTLTNVLISLKTVGDWILGVAIYRCVKR